MPFGTNAKQSAAQAAAAIAVPPLTSEEITFARTVFYKHVNLHVADLHTLRLILSELGQLPSDGELQFVYTRLNGTIPFTDFCRYLQFRKKHFVKTKESAARRRNEDTMRAFVALGGEPDGNGSVSVEVMQRACEQFGLTINVEEMARQAQEEPQNSPYGAGTAASRAQSRPQSALPAPPIHVEQLSYTDFYRVWTMQVKHITAAPATPTDASPSSGDKNDDGSDYGSDCNTDEDAGSNANDEDDDAGELGNGAGEDGANAAGEDGVSADAGERASKPKRKSGKGSKKHHHRKSKDVSKAPAEKLSLGAEEAAFVAANGGQGIYAVDEWGLLAAANAQSAETAGASDANQPSGSGGAGDDGDAESGMTLYNILFGSARPSNVGNKGSRGGVRGSGQGQWKSGGYGDDGQHGGAQKGNGQGGGKMNVIASLLQETKRMRALSIGAGGNEHSMNPTVAWGTSDANGAWKADASGNNGNNGPDRRGSGGTEGDAPLTEEEALKELDMILQQPQKAEKRGKDDNGKQTRRGTRRSLIQRASRIGLVGVAPSTPGAGGATPQVGSRLSAGGPAGLGGAGNGSAGGRVRGRGAGASGRGGRGAGGYAPTMQSQRNSSSGSFTVAAPAGDGADGGARSNETGDGDDDDDENDDSAAGRGGGAGGYRPPSPMILSLRNHRLRQQNAVRHKQQLNRLNEKYDQQRVELRQQLAGSSRGNGNAAASGSASRKGAAATTSSSGYLPQLSSSAGKKQSTSGRPAASASATTRY